MLVDPLATDQWVLYINIQGADLGNLHGWGCVPKMFGRMRPRQRP